MRRPQYVRATHAWIDNADTAAAEIDVSGTIHYII